MNQCWVNDKAVSPTYRLFVFKAMGHVGWAAFWDNSTLDSINVGLTIRPLTQPTDYSFLKRWFM